MNKLTRTFILFVFSTFFSNYSFASLEQAVANYKNVFDVPKGSKFANSPYFHNYLLTYNNTFTIFDKNIALHGYQQNWHLRLDEKQAHKKMNFDQAEGIKSALMKNLKTDWMINAGYGTGGKNIVVISAPNCGICRKMESDMSKHGSSVPASMFVVPMLLGRGNDSYRNAIMCSQDPSAAWKNSFKSTSYPSSASGCEKSLWAEIVIDNAFPSANGQMSVSTPAIIMPDGTVIKGWDGKKSIEMIKQKLR